MDKAHFGYVRLRQHLWSPEPLCHPRFFHAIFISLPLVAIPLQG